MIPYGLLGKVGAYLLVALLLLSTALYIAGLRRSATSAQEAADRLRRELTVQKANGAFALRLAARSADRERSSAAEAENLRSKVRKAAVPVPASCKQAMKPIQEALDGLRAIQAREKR